MKSKQSSETQSERKNKTKKKKRAIRKVHLKERVSLKANYELALAHLDKQKSCVERQIR